MFNTKAKRTVLAIALTLFPMLAGCSLTWQDIRLPTRPDGAISGSTGDGTTVAGDFGAGTGASCVQLGPPGDGNRLQMFEAISDYREQNGLNRLEYSQVLQQAADEFAKQMWREGFFDHTDPDGKGPSDRALAAGFCDEIVGENIAYGLNQMTSAAETMTGFKNSPSHNDNMLNPLWDYVGIGYLQVAGLQGSEYWWVQLFGTDRNAQ